MKAKSFLGPLLLVLVAGCGQKADDSKSASQTATATKPKLTKLNVVVKKEGTGEPLKLDDQVYMQYTGKLADGTVFDSNDKEGGKPLAFPLGRGNVIKGWDEGVTGMKVGEEAEIQVPSDLGYGARGVGSIPPDSDLYFTVKVLDVIRAGENNSKVTVTDLKEGTGPEVKAGSTVSIEYVGTYVSGRQFEKNKATFTDGKGQVIPGIDLGIVGMKAGGKRRLRVFPGAGYAKGGPETVDGTQILIFEITVTSVK